MPEEKTCPRCGRLTATSLACEYCGYLFQVEEGEVEMRVPSGHGRRPLRLNLRALLTAGGVLVASMCLCPQMWLVVGDYTDQILGLKTGFWNLSSLISAALFVCPLVYGVVLLGVGILAWRRSRQASSPQ